MTDNAETADEVRACPWCAETIKTAAKICRFCGRDMTATSEVVSDADGAQEVQEDAASAEEHRVSADRADEVCGKCGTVQSVPLKSNTWTCESCWASMKRQNCVGCSEGIMVARAGWTGTKCRHCGTMNAVTPDADLTRVASTRTGQGHGFWTPRRIVGTTFASVAAIAFIVFAISLSASNNNNNSSGSASVGAVAFLVAIGAGVCARIAIQGFRSASPKSSTVRTITIKKNIASHKLNRLAAAEIDKQARQGYHLISRTDNQSGWTVPYVTMTFEKR